MIIFKMMHPPYFYYDLPIMAASNTDCWKY